MNPSLIRDVNIIYLKLFFIGFFVSFVGCESIREKRADSFHPNKSYLEPAEMDRSGLIRRENKGSLEIYLSQRVAAVPLGRKREMSLTEHSPEIQVLQNGSFPFFEFQLDESPRLREKLIIETQAIPLGRESVGISDPIAAYTIIQGSLTELRLLGKVHRSDSRSCLGAKWFFDLSKIPRGVRIAVVNKAKGFDQSMGKIQVSNPGLALKKSRAQCSLISVYPSPHGLYKIYLGQY